MIKFFFLGVFILSTPYAVANAEADLHFIRQRLAQYKKVQGKFKQVRFVKEMKLNLQSEGDFTFEVPLQLSWIQKNPFKMDILMTAEKILQKNTDGSVQEMKKEQQPVVFAISTSFLGVLLGDEQVIKKDFKYDVQRHGKKWRMTLQPSSEILNKIISDVKLSGSNFVEKVEIIEKTGNTTAISFSGVKGLK